MSFFALAVWRNAQLPLSWTFAVTAFGSAYFKSKYPQPPDVAYSLVFFTATSAP